MVTLGSNALREKISSSVHVIETDMLELTIFPELPRLKTSCFGALLRVSAGLKKRAPFHIIPGVSVIPLCEIASTLVVGFIFGFVMIRIVWIPHGTVFSIVPQISLLVKISLVDKITKYMFLYVFNVSFFLGTAVPLNFPPEPAKEL